MFVTHAASTFIVTNTATWSPYRFGVPTILGSQRLVSSARGCCRRCQNVAGDPLCVVRCLRVPRFQQRSLASSGTNGVQETHPDALGFIARGLILGVRHARSRFLLAAARPPAAFGGGLVLCLSSEEATHLLTVTAPWSPRRWWQMQPRSYPSWPIQGSRGDGGWMAGSWRGDTAGLSHFCPG